MFMLNKLFESESESESNRLSINESKTEALLKREL